MVCGRHRIAAGAGFRLDAGSESSRAAPVGYREHAVRPARSTRTARFTMRSEPNRGESQTGFALLGPQQGSSDRFSGVRKREQDGPRAAVALTRKPPREDT